jgi:hypothetical protein
VERTDKGDRKNGKDKASAADRPVKSAKPAKTQRKPTERPDGKSPALSNQQPAADLTPADTAAVGSAEDRNVAR